MIEKTQEAKAPEVEPVPIIDPDLQNGLEALALLIEVQGKILMKIAKIIRELATLLDYLLDAASARLAAFDFHEEIRLPEKLAPGIKDSP